ncbi:Uncharacterised protein [Mycobacterium tuberculosis]|uniref:Uncharacterized protein n=1 Tax=Mycobacterium tuberculosis TaxID=1773 RepID=A0A916PHI0_MYCTX|nr:Uncharacterised protein [Mycobacterium tuberculosis]CPA96778.1 Uncharacterised protein [Mycobacterium tuberculosis]
MPHRLEAADRAVELFTGARIFGRHLQSALEHTELKSGAAQGGKRAEPNRDIGSADPAGGVHFGPV